MAIESIAKTLGTGSGIDVTALVTQLVDAQFAYKNAALTKKSDALTAQISTAGSIKSGISDFATALAQLASGGTLATQPTSSNSNVLTVSRLSGAKLAGLNATVEVQQLAQGQVGSTGSFPDGGATVVPTGTLTLTFGKASVTDGAMTDFTVGSAAPVEIAIGSGNATLQGVANAINAAKAGVTASILSDANGSRLVVKSPTGASQAFELTGSEGLEDLDIGRDASNSSVNASAQDAKLLLDGVPVQLSNNSVYGLVPGVKIDLVSAAIGTRVSIGAKSPTTELSNTVTNFVDTYNEVYKAIRDAVDPVTGPLKSDPAAQDLFRQMKSLTLAVLTPGAAAGVPKTLSGLGVATQRDGTLAINSAQLSSALLNFPSDVEAIFAQDAGLSKALSAIATKAVSTTVGLGASEASYTKAQSSLETDQEKIVSATETLRARMTQQFAAMDAKVAAYKSTQTFLEQQVKAWNSSN